MKKGSGGDVKRKKENAIKSAQCDEHGCTCFNFRERKKKWQ